MAIDGDDKQLGQAHPVRQHGSEQCANKTERNGDGKASARTAIVVCLLASLERIEAPDQTGDMRRA
jgi:hypothetical protein